MNLDLSEMTRRNSCFPGLEWWSAAFGDKPVDYQDVLDRLALENRVDWARWLMHEVGAPATMYDVSCRDIHTIGLTLPVRKTRAAGQPVGHVKNYFCAGNLTARNIHISGVLLVAGRLDAEEIDAASVIADGGIEAKRITVDDNIICIGGKIMVGEMDAVNIRSGDCILANTIAATGTVRAVTHITCPKVEAGSVVEYCTGLKPHKARVGAAKTGHIGAPRRAAGFTLQSSE